MSDSQQPESKPRKNLYGRMSRTLDLRLLRSVKESLQSIGSDKQHQQQISPVHEGGELAPLQKEPQMENDLSKVRDTSPRSDALEPVKECSLEEENGPSPTVVKFNKPLPPGAKRGVSARSELLLQRARSRRGSAGLMSQFSVSANHLPSEQQQQQQPGNQGTSKPEDEKAGDGSQPNAAVALTSPPPPTPSAPAAGPSRKQTSPDVLRLSVKDLTLSNQDTVSPKVSQQQQREQQSSCSPEELSPSEKSQQIPTKERAMSVPSLSNGPALAQTVHETMVYLEILGTEKSYVQDLKILRDLYYLPLRNSAEKGLIGITVDKVHAIFSNLEELIKINSTLLDAIDSGHQSGQDLPKVYVEAFEKVMPYFRAYALYCNNYHNALVLCDQLRKADDVFEDFLQKSKAEKESKGLDLASFLIKPVQRICKYPLFFKDLIKHSVANQEYHQQLSKTYDEVQRIATQVNGKMEKAASQNKVYEIFMKFSGEVVDLVDPARSFCLEGCVDLKAQSSGRKEYHYFVFSDLLLLGRPNTGFRKYQQSGTLHLKFRWNLKDLRVVQPSISTAGSSSCSSLSSLSSSSSSFSSTPSSCSSISTTTTTTAAGTTPAVSIPPSLSSTSLVSSKEDPTGGYPLSLLVAGTLSSKKGVAATVDRYQLWCRTERERDALVRVLEEKIEECHKQADELKSRVRSSSTTKTRKWASLKGRSRANSNMKTAEKAAGGGGGGGGGTGPGERLDRGESSAQLEEILHKYQSKRFSLDMHHSKEAISGLEGASDADLSKKLAGDGGGGGESPELSAADSATA